jgi:hypothetical protein
MAAVPLVLGVVDMALLKALGRFRRSER